MSLIQSIINSAKQLTGWPELEANKSLRDQQISSDLLPTSSGSIAVVRTSGADRSSRFFKKRNVMTLRNYAEFSTIVRSAIDIYRNCIAQAEVQVVPYDPKRPMNERVRKDILNLIKKPNLAGKPYSVIKEEFTEDYLVIGHGGIEKGIRRDLTPYGLWSIDAARLAFIEEWDGTDLSLPRYAEINYSGQTRRWIPDPMAMVLVNRPRSYDVLGLSHVEALDTAVRALLEGDDTFLQQMIDRTASGALDLGEGTTQTQVDQVRQEITALRKAFIVMGGTKNPKFVTFDASERDIRALDKLLYFKRQVAAIFQLPMAVLGETVDTSRANTEALLENADKGPGALLWRIKEMENTCIVLPFGDYEEHNCMIDYPIMSKRDEKQQAEVSKIQTGGVAWSTVNEARRAGGLEPRKEKIADEILIKTTGGVIPLSQIEAQFNETEEDPEATDRSSSEDAAGGKQLRLIKSGMPFEHVSKSGHDYSCAMVMLPDDLAGAIVEFADNIPDSDLAADGREDKPHVTVKYGLETSKADDLREALKGQKPITLRFGKTAIFAGDEYDVVFVEVKSRELEKLHQLICDSLEHVNTHAEYIPHATVAYVKAGQGEIYAGDDFLSGKKAVIDSVVFSTKGDRCTVIKLEGE